MGILLNSFDTLNSQAQAQGNFIRLHFSKIGSSTTPATTASGYTTAQRSPDVLTAPSFGAQVGAAYCSYCPMVTDNASETQVAAIEYLLGSLTVNGNSFSAGVTMPTKSVRGGSAQCGSSMLVVAVITNMTATTPTLTITYTNQDGTTGKTATLTLPTNATANSVFRIDPHFANGDTGARAVTNISISAGTAGTLRVYGLLPVGSSPQMTGALVGSADPLTIPIVPWLLAAGDVIGFYRFGSSSPCDLFSVIDLEPDTP